MVTSLCLDFQVWCFKFLFLLTLSDRADTGVGHWDSPPPPQLSAHKPVSPHSAAPAQRSAQSKKSLAFNLTTTSFFFYLNCLSIWPPHLFRCALKLYTYIHTCTYVFICCLFDNVRLDEGGKKHLRLTTERSKKPTMAREWRKLNQKNKSRTETEVVEKKKKEVMELVFLEAKLLYYSIFFRSGASLKSAS